MLTERLERGPVPSAPHDVPRAKAPWWVSAWGIGGVCLLLSFSVWRMAAFVDGMFEHGLTGPQIAFTIGWVIFMLVTESYNGFHQRLSPRLVRRAREIPMDRPLLVVFAPLVCMGFFYGTRRRVVASWVLLTAIIVLVFFIRQLDQPWRGMIDLGVVIGLSAGTASILWFAARAALGDEPDVDPEWPA